MQARSSRSSEICQGIDGRPFRVMVVDDSAVVRGLISRWIEADPEIAVVGSASNGVMALNSIRRNRAEIVLLDVEMPEMDGLTALPKLLKIDPTIKVIMASTLTRRGAEISIRAMAAGAADYVPKPESTRDANDASTFRRTLIQKIKALGAARRRGLSGESVASGQPRISHTLRKGGPEIGGQIKLTLRKPSGCQPAVLGIGSSTGGPQALLKVVRGLSPGFQLPILITQHMPATFTAILAEHLGRISNRPCAEAEDGEPIEPGRIYVASGGLHLTMVEKGGRPVVELNEDSPENYCRPSVDQLFGGIARVYGPEALCLVLTGMGHDGLAGSKKIVEAGGTVIAQDEPTSVVWGMPGAVTKAGICSSVLPLDEISDTISRFAAGGAL